MKGAKTLRNAVLLVGGLFLAFGLALPFVRIERFRVPIEQALERSLDREVEIGGPLRLRVFPWPGFTVENVVIQEGSAWGIEPTAYVSTLEGDVRLGRLLQGRLAFSSLRLVRPSVNLVKNRQGEWNYPVLLERAFGGGESGGQPLPRIEVRSGRLNFKFETTKSVLYFANADVDISPSPQSAGTVQVRFAGEPARTDRAAQGFGRLSGNGQVRDLADGEKRVDFVLRLERSAISEVATLLRGSGAGLGGFVASRAELTGPVSAIRVNGNLNLTDVDQRFLLPSPAGEWALEYTGELNLVNQTLSLETRSSTGQVPPITIRVRVSDYLAQPRWALSATAADLPLDTLPALAREIGMGFPAELSLSGTASGALSWTSSQKVQGSLSVRNLAIARSGGARIQASEAILRVAGDRWSVEPCTVDLPEAGQAQVAADYDSSGALEIRMEIDKIPIPRFRSVWQSLTAAEAPSVLLLCQSGTAGGFLRFRRSSAGVTDWTGTIAVNEGRVAVAGVTKDLNISRARVSLARDAFGIDSFEGTVGGIPVSGDYRLNAAADRPHQFRLAIPAISASDLESLLSPTLYRQRGFLARTLRLRPGPVPAWLRSRRVAGEFQVGKLQAAGLEFHSITGMLYWDGSAVELPRIEGRFEDSTLTGRLSIDLAGPTPAYRMQGRIRGFSWAEGSLNAEGRMKTSGVGAEVLLNLSAEGEFRARSIRLSPDRRPAQVNGCYELSMTRGASLLRFPCLEIAQGGRTYWGFGQASLAGELDVELFNSAGNYRLEGTLAPLEATVREQKRTALE